jgi:hypothetical protein
VKTPATSAIKSFTNLMGWTRPRGDLMATVIIPTRTDGVQRYSLRCQLGDRYFTLEFRWNARDSVLGVRHLRRGRQRARRAEDRRRDAAHHPPGRRANAGRRVHRGRYDRGKDQDPGLTELGSRVLLTFTDAADFV